MHCWVRDSLAESFQCSHGDEELEVGVSGYGRQDGEQSREQNADAVHQFAAKYLRYSAARYLEIGLAL